MLGYEGDQIPGTVVPDISDIQGVLGHTIINLSSEPNYVVVYLCKIPVQVLYWDIIFSRYNYVNMNNFYHTVSIASEVTFRCLQVSDGS